MTALDPDVLRARSRDCNDGGGRNDRPTLLVALATLRRPEHDNLITLDEAEREALAAWLGIQSKSLRQEIRQIETRTGRLYFMDLPDGDWRIRITAKGREYLGEDVLAALNENAPTGARWPRARR